ncbi:hypothetical protein [Klebsiella quasipneumoniae]|uniref:hypothetical protein n=1 Tax=Klebsiella quasipneumoniae TaxID=1463165 RepID=UPI0023E2946F|nr:hypothetical protein [Klebsiella quasipneumoniae]
MNSLWITDSGYGLSYIQVENYQRVPLTAYLMRVGLSIFTLLEAFAHHLPLLNLISDGYYEKINFTELTTLAHSVDISLISDVKNVTNTGVAEYNDN